MRVKSLFKFLCVSVILTFFIFGGICLFYVNGLPKLVNSYRGIKFIENILSKSLDSEVKIEKLYLKTELSPNITLNVKKITVTKDGNELLFLDNIESNISLEKILQKKIILKKITADYIFANVSSVFDLPLFKQTSKKDNGVNVDIFQSVMDIKNSDFFYRIDKENSLDVNAKDVKISGDELKKPISYDIKVDLCREHKYCVLISALENGQNTYIKNKNNIIVKNGNLMIDKSNILLNGNVDFNGIYNFNFKGNNFSIVNTMEILATKFIDNNFDDYFAYFSDISGNYDFDADVNNDGINGKIKLNKLSFNLVPLENIPVTLEQGDVKFDNNVITLNNFKGFYNNRSENKMDFGGTVKDYLKSVDTDLVGNAIVTDDFAKNYLSKIISYPVGMKGIAKTRVMLKSKYNKIDITWLYLFKKGTGFIVDGEEPELNKIAHRILVAKMSIDGLLLKIKSLDYHLATEDGQRKKDRTPIISMKGNIDFSDNKQPVKDFGITLTKPMPSAFLNLLLKENVFRGGTFTGNMNILNTGEYPVLNGNLKAEKVGIPSQRLFIRNGEFSGKDSFMDIHVDGRYRKSDYVVDAKIENKVLFPIIVKDSTLTIDNMDVEKYMQMLNEQTSSGRASDNFHKTISQSNKTESFDLANIIVEKCNINIKKGHYKNINFDNVVGNLSLNKDSILSLKSNRFNIAEGKAESSSVCDLKHHKYNMTLALLGVNSDLMASELVNLPKEINGKASGIMNLNMDETLRLNGTIKFIVQNGVIAKMGLVEYTMKVAALFRNPIVMITPAVISDLVDVPEGKFDRINGDLTIENNVIRRLVIKSVSPQLSTYIVGRYNLHNQDAILRIYTKFSNKRKGAFGFLRNISLNSLANRIPLSSSNNSNYYASEISELPKIESGDQDTQIFLTTVDGDIVTNNFISSLKKIK